MINKKIYPVLLVLLAAVAAVFLLTQKSRDSGSAFQDPDLHNTEIPLSEPKAGINEAGGKTVETVTEKPYEQPFLAQITDNDPAIAYVLVRMPDPIGLLPLPTEEDYTRTIRQTMNDGTEAINVLHLTANGFWMEDANCEGHDCINEGEVTLENREERVLWNMVICLPHQLALELITREEAMTLLNR